MLTTFTFVNMIRFYFKLPLNQKESNANTLFD